MGQGYIIYRLAEFRISKFKRSEEISNLLAN